VHCWLIGVLLLSVVIRAADPANFGRSVAETSCLLSETRWKLALAYMHACQIMTGLVAMRCNYRSNYRCIVTVLY